MTETERYLEARAFLYRADKMSPEDLYTEFRKWAARIEGGRASLVDFSHALVRRHAETARREISMQSRNIELLVAKQNELMEIIRVLRIKINALDKGEETQ